MKVIIAGGRDFTNEDWLVEVMLRLYPEWYPEEEIVSGCARGADELGEWYAERYGIPIKRFPADWQTHGKAAGPIRNKAMADYADVLVVFWDGKSKGTKHMIETALRAGLEVHVYRYGS